MLQTIFLLFPSALLCEASLDLLFRLVAKLFDGNFSELVLGAVTKLYLRSVVRILHDK